jgi:hypothetical protein
VDPDNLLLSRASVRRLDAETLRDAMLSVSGQLNPKMFGPPVPVMLDTDGQVIVGVDTTDTAGRPTGKVVPLNGEEFRRSVYVQMRRTRPLALLEAFDLPKMEPNCELRSASTVAPQSLTLMNSAFALGAAEHGFRGNSDTFENHLGGGLCVPAHLFLIGTETQPCSVIFDDEGRDPAGTVSAGACHHDVHI